VNVEERETTTYPHNVANIAALSTSYVEAIGFTGGRLHSHSLESVCDGGYEEAANVLVLPLRRDLPDASGTYT
jgi:hypothetical protein